MQKIVIAKYAPGKTLLLCISFYIVHALLLSSSYVRQRFLTGLIDLDWRAYVSISGDIFLLLFIIALSVRVLVGDKVAVWARDDDLIWFSPILWKVRKDDITDVVEGTYLRINGSIDVVLRSGGKKQLITTLYSTPPVDAMRLIREWAGLDR